MISMRFQTDRIPTPMRTIVEDMKNSGICDVEGRLVYAGPHPLNPEVLPNPENK